MLHLTVAVQTETAQICSYIDNFEEQLIGAHPGDKVEVKVTFPDDYQATDLAGKEAVFDVTVNGIYE